MPTIQNYLHLTRRHLIRGGAILAGAMSFGNVWGSIPDPVRTFEHGRPLGEFDYRCVRFQPGPINRSSSRRTRF